MEAARVDLLAAYRLRPDDREVVGLLRLLQHGEQQQRDRVRRAEEAAEEAQAEHAMAIAAGEALRAALDPKQAPASAAYGQFAPAESPAAAASTAAVAPTAGTAPAAAAAAATPIAVPPAAATPVVPKAHPAPPASSAAAAGPRVELKYGWARAWLEEKMVRMACQDEDGAIVVVCGLCEMSGEASVTTSTGPRGRRTHVFDLRFELEWQARCCDTHLTGRLVFTEVASHNEPDEYVLSVSFDNQPEQGSDTERTLVNLFGPLRPAAARAAEDKLTHKLWAQVDAFRAEFMRL